MWLCHWLSWPYERGQYSRVEWQGLTCCRNYSGEIKYNVDFAYRRESTNVISYRWDWEEVSGSVWEGPNLYQSTGGWNAQVAMEAIIQSSRSISNLQARLVWKKPSCYSIPSPLSIDSKIMTSPPSRITAGWQTSANYMQKFSTRS
jgi:hypothetical protein